MRCPPNTASSRSRGSLIVDQIKFADIVVLNKVTAAGHEKAAAARRIVSALNPDTHLINPVRAHSHPLRFKELHVWDLVFRLPRARRSIQSV